MTNTDTNQPGIELSAADRIEIALHDMLECTIAEVYKGACKLNGDEQEQLFLLNVELTQAIRRKAFEEGIQCALRDATKRSVIFGRDPTRLPEALALTDLLAFALGGLVSAVGKERLSVSLREVLDSPDPHNFESSSVVRTMGRHLSPEDAGRAAGPKS